MKQWEQAFKSMAPSAGNPGMGQGNIPFAPGAMTGNFGGQQGGMSGLLQNIQQRQNGAQARQLGSAVVSGADPSSVPPPQPQMVWTPEVQAQIMQYLMSIYKQARPGDRMTTTGGMIQRG